MKDVYTIIVIALILAIASLVLIGCAPEPRPVRTTEQKVQSFLRIFTDPNMVPVLRHIRIKQMESIMEKELEELDRERALNQL